MSAAPRVHVPDQARRRLLGTAHSLDYPTTSVEQVAANLVGLHATDPATVFLSARARVSGLTAQHVETALYEDRTLLRVLGMRRTMFVVPTRDASLLEAGCTRAMVASQRKRLLTMLAHNDVAPDPDEWLRSVMARTLTAIRDLGPSTAAEITRVVPELATKMTVAEGKTWGGQIGLSTRVLFLLATEGVIIRAQPRGTWRSSLYEWTDTEAWVGTPLPQIDPATARSDLAHRWLGTYGPATVNDLRWWSGWTVAQTKAALAAHDVVQVSLDGGGEGCLLASQLDPVAAATRSVDTDTRPWVALLPALDQAVMGWKERAWFLPADPARIFDRNGNVGPTVWAAGRIVGGWGQRPDGRVAWEPLASLDSGTVRRVEREVVRMQEWLDGVTVIPRFRTPLEKELMTG